MGVRVCTYAYIRMLVNLFLCPLVASTNMRGVPQTKPVQVKDNYKALVSEIGSVTEMKNFMLFAHNAEVAGEFAF